MHADTGDYLGGSGTADAGHPHGIEIPEDGAEWLESLINILVSAPVNLSPDAELAAQMNIGTEAEKGAATDGWLVASGRIKRGRGRYGAYAEGGVELLGMGGNAQKAKTEDNRE